jgi:hypothetical protein
MHPSRPLPSLRLSLITSVLLLTFFGVGTARSQSSGVPRSFLGTATVNFTDLARQERLQTLFAPPVRVRPENEAFEENEMSQEPGAGVIGAPATEGTVPNLVATGAGPAPLLTFQGLDDIPMADSSYIIIPPDVSGAVGPSRVMCGFNNNYRIQDKATGATVFTVGTATFWNPVVANKALLNQLTDPRTVYDPIQNCWIVAMQTTNSSGLILIGVSQTSDPAGSWRLYSLQLSPTGYLIDFPTLGFNKNWICVSINRYTSPAGAFSRGVQAVLDYGAARAGTITSFTQFDPGNNGGRFCVSPAVTISATEDTLFLPTHLGSAGATYQVDVITGTPSAPVYTSGTSQTRPGGGWTQPTGNALPQSAPNSGTSACGATPCPIETQDSQIRSAPTYRIDSTTGRGYLYYTQTVQLSTPTRIAVQWTKLTPGGGGTTPVFADGGRIDDPSGAQFFAYGHIAVNSVGDFLVGYSRFGSAVHPSSGYSMHFASEGLGSMRDPFIYKPGDDYYHKTFSTTTGRNRWGDFSSAVVDPVDDRSLWVLQEYAKTRPGTDDGNTGGNSSRWSSQYAAVGTAPTVTIAPGPSQPEGNSGTTTFNFTVNLSNPLGLPVTVNYQTADGTATTADNDYVAANSSIVIPAGSTSGTIPITVNGDTNCEGNETFSVNLTGAIFGTIGVPSSSTGTILNDDSQATSAINDLASSQVRTGNDADGTTKITVNFTTPNGASSVEVWRKGFGNYPAYDDPPSPGSVPTLPASYPPAGWTLTGVTAGGQTDEPSTRDFWYYVAYAKDACGGVSPVSNMTAGSLDYHLGDVTDGVTPGAGDNQVSAADLALLTAHYGASGGALAPFKYLDVGPTSTTTVLGLPATDDVVDFEDMMMFALNYTPATSLARSHPRVAPRAGSQAAATSSTIFLQAPTSVNNGDEFIVRLKMGAGGDLQGLSTTLTWNPAVAAPISLEVGSLLASESAVLLSSAPGVVDAALLGPRGTGLSGDGDLALVHFQASADGDPQVAIDHVLGRSSTNSPITVQTGVTAVEDAPVTRTELAPPIPNPMSRNALLQYSLLVSTQVDLSIYSVDGRRVRTITRGSQQGGRYRFNWNGADDRGNQARSGIYFVRLDAGTQHFTRKLVLAGN